jgi:hypothetical protein
LAPRDFEQNIIQDFNCVRTKKAQVPQDLIVPPG